jgi:hypothetical protein
MKTGPLPTGTAALRFIITVASIEPLLMCDVRARHDGTGWHLTVRPEGEPPLDVFIPARAAPFLDWLRARAATS